MMFDLAYWPTDCYLKFALFPCAAVSPSASCDIEFHFPQSSSLLNVMMVMSLSETRKSITFSLLTKLVTNIISMSAPIAWSDRFGSSVRPSQIQTPMSWLQLLTQCDSSNKRH